MSNYSQIAPLIYYQNITGPRMIYNRVLTISNTVLLTINDILRVPGILANTANEKKKNENK